MGWVRLTTRNYYPIILVQLQRVQHKQEKQMVTLANNKPLDFLLKE